MNKEFSKQRQKETKENEAQKASLLKGIARMEGREEAISTHVPQLTNHTEKPSPLVQEEGSDQGHGQVS